MDHYRVCDASIVSVKECLTDAHTQFLSCVVGKVGNNLQERLQGQHVSNIFGLGKHIREELLEGADNGRAQTAQVVESIIKAVEDERVEFVLFVTRQVLEDEVGEGAEEIEQDSEISDFADVRPGEYDQLPTLWKGDLAEPF